MKHLAAFLLVNALYFTALGGQATNCEDGSNRNVFYGADTRF